MITNLDLYTLLIYFYRCFYIYENEGDTFTSGFHPTTNAVECVEPFFKVISNLVYIFDSNLEFKGAKNQRNHQKNKCLN